MSINAYNTEEVITITGEIIAAYLAHLADHEKAAGTVDDYQRYVRRFAAFLGERPLSHEAAIEWKKSLEASALSAATVNVCISAVNSLLRFLHREDCLLQRLRVQRRTYRDDSRDLNKKEFDALVGAAKRKGRRREALLLTTLGGTGIRVSELHYITVEAAQAGKAEISLKGKVRTILLPERVRSDLLRYAAQAGITTGEIFRTRAGTPMNRRQVWAALKALAPFAGIAATKVFPHNLRHLFAVTFYRTYRDIAALADILGHSSTDTTRIYLMTTGEEHLRRLNGLGLVA